VAIFLVFSFSGCAEVGEATEEVTEEVSVSEEIAEEESSERALPEKIVIGWSPPDIHGVFATATEYFEKCAEDARKAGLNVEVIMHSTASHTDFAGQVDIIEDFVANKVDCIIVSPADVEPMKPGIAEANRNNIPFIIVNLLEPIEGVDVTSFIGFDNSEAAEVSAYSVLDYLGGPGVLGEGEMIDNPPEYLDLEFWRDLYKDINPAESNIGGKLVLVEGLAGSFYSNTRLEGFHNVIDEYPGIEILATLPADWTRERGVEVGEDILETYSDIDVIWSVSNEQGFGVLTAIESAGRQDEIGFFTNDGTPESVQAIKDGRIVAETWHGFPEWGWYGCKFGILGALGLEDQIPYQFDIRPRTEYKGNADDFYPNVKLESIDWEEMIEQYNMQ